MLRIATLLLLLASPALAQQQPAPDPSPVILFEITIASPGLNRQARLVDLKIDWDWVEYQIKRLIRDDKLFRPVTITIGRVLSGTARGRLMKSR